MEKNIFFKNLIFKKYKILGLLGTGSFGYVFKGINKINNEKVAIKVEDWKNKGDLLESEAYFLYYLKGFGIPEVKSFGVCGKYKVLVETLLADSLEVIFKQSNNKFALKDLCMIGIQLIDRLEFIHSKYIIHRDIKPENIAVDYETKKTIYLIDFGLAKKYRSSRTGNHIKFSVPKTLTGTARYSSVNALGGKQLSRRDDLESMGYVLIYFGRKGFLPWMGLKAKNKIDRIKKIYHIKKNIKAEQLCFSLPTEFSEYIKYIKGLKFEEEPNYNYLHELFQIIMKKNNFSNDCLNFSWLKYKKISQKKQKEFNILENINKKVPVNLLKRKESPQKRLYARLVKNQEKYNKNRKIIITEIQEQENITNNLNVFQDSFKDDNRTYSTKRMRGKKETSTLSDKFGTQKTQINLSIDIDEDTIEKENNQISNIIEINKKSDFKIPIKFNKIPLKRSLSLNDMEIDNKKEPYCSNIKNEKNEEFNSGKNKKIINTIYYQNKEINIREKEKFINNDKTLNNKENKIIFNSHQKDNQKKKCINKRINIKNGYSINSMENNNHNYSFKNIFNKNFVSSNNNKNDIIIGQINTNKYNNNYNRNIINYNYINDKNNLGLSRQLNEGKKNKQSLKYVSDIKNIINLPKSNGHKISYSPNNEHIARNNYINQNTPIKTINQPYKIPVKKKHIFLNTKFINEKISPNHYKNMTSVNMYKNSNSKYWERINEYDTKKNNKRINFNKELNNTFINHKKIDYNKNFKKEEEKNNFFSNIIIDNCVVQTKKKLTEANINTYKKINLHS